MSRARTTAGATLYLLGAATLGLAEGTQELWRSGTEPAFARAPAVLAFAVGTWMAPALLALAAGLLLTLPARAARLRLPEHAAVAVATGLFGGLLGWQALGRPGLGLTSALLATVLSAVLLERLLRRRPWAGPLVLGLVVALCFVGIAWEFRGRAPGVPQRDGARGRPDVVVIVADALRADALSCYGGTTATPAIDRVGQEGWVVPDAISTSSWTLPAVASLWSARSPRHHGVTTYSSVLADEDPLLQEALGAAGYVTAAVVANPLVDPGRGFGRGFDLFRGDTHQVEQGLFWVLRLHRWLRAWGWITGPNAGRKLPLPTLSARDGLRVRRTGYMDAEEVTGTALELVDQVGDQPLFLYLHYLDPHDPYLEQPAGLVFREPEFTPENRDELRRRYAAEVAWLDQQVGALREGLEERGRWRNSLVVFTADHGEEFLDHGGWLHGESLYDELVRVPLLVRFPEGRDVPPAPPAASLLDVSPTILATLDLPALPGATGADLRQADPERLRYADRTSDRNWLAAVRTPARHWIATVREMVGADGGRPADAAAIRGAFEERAILEGFERPGDPDQRRDLAEQEPEAAGRARALLMEYLAGTRFQAGRGLSREEEARLRAMGYLK